MANQPTATQFTRTQESWANHLLEKIDQQIDERETFLRNKGVPTEDFDKDVILIELYEDALFYERYAEEMKTQRGYIHDKYIGGK